MKKKSTTSQSEPARCSHTRAFVQTGDNVMIGGFNDKGEAEALRYEAVNAMLLNEFLKEHRKVEK
jgi:hypothetical protein